MDSSRIWTLTFGDQCSPENFLVQWMANRPGRESEDLGAAHLPVTLARSLTTLDRCWEKHVPAQELNRCEEVDVLSRGNSWTREQELGENLDDPSLNSSPSNLPHLKTICPPASFCKIPVLWIIM